MTVLATYEAARAALAAAVTADEVMRVHLSANALKALARIAKDPEMEISATKLRVRAEERLGQMLLEAEHTGMLAEGRPPKTENDQKSERFSRATLKEIGVDRYVSARSQRLAGIGQRAVEAMLRRFEDESRAKGRVRHDILAAADRDLCQSNRRKLERELSDTSATLSTGRLFPTIYADPATRFLSGFSDRSIENHYPTMSLDDLCALPVGDRALKPHARLFIWSTVPQLANTFTIAQAWGFPDYSSHMVWDKTDPDSPDHAGTGHVFRNQHELLLYFKRGKPAGPTRGTQPLSIYRERKREHSRKPDHFRQVIIDLTDNLPVLELFARVDAEHPLPAGWESWGNQAHDPQTGEIAA